MEPLLLCLLIEPYTLLEQRINSAEMSLGCLQLNQL